MDGGRPNLSHLISGPEVCKILNKVNLALRNKSNRLERSRGYLNANTRTCPSLFKNSQAFQTGCITKKKVLGSGWPLTCCPREDTYWKTTPRQREVPSKCTWEGSGAGNLRSWSHDSDSFPHSLYDLRPASSLRGSICPSVHRNEKIRKTKVLEVLSIGAP